MWDVTGVEKESIMVRLGLGKMQAYGEMQQDGSDLDPWASASIILRFQFSLAVVQFV